MRTRVVRSQVDGRRMASEPELVAVVHRPGACAVTNNEEPGRLSGICQVTRSPAPSVDPAFLADVDSTRGREPTRGPSPEVAAGSRARQAWPNLPRRPSPPSGDALAGLFFVRPGRPATLLGSVRPTASDLWQGDASHVSHQCPSPSAPTPAGRRQRVSVSSALSRDFT